MAPHLFHIRRDPTAVVVQAAGELDAYLVPSLVEAVDKALDTDVHLPLVLDLARVEFLDSTALGAVVGAYRKATERDRPFTIVAPSGHARRIFLHTKLDGVLPLIDPPEATDVT